MPPIGWEAEEIAITPFYVTEHDTDGNRPPTTLGQDNDKQNQEVAKEVGDKGDESEPSEEDLKRNLRDSFLGLEPTKIDDFLSWMFDTAATARGRELSPGERIGLLQGINSLVASGEVTAEDIGYVANLKNQPPPMSMIPACSAASFPYCQPSPLDLDIALAGAGIDPLLGAGVLAGRLVMIPDPYTTAAGATIALGIGVAALISLAVNGGKVYRASTGIYLTETEERSRKNAYDVASEGGKHSGFLDRYREETEARIKKGIESLDDEINEHLEKVGNPKDYYDNWDSFHPNRQKHLLEKKWPQDIERLSEQKEILEGILIRR